MAGTLSRDVPAGRSSRSSSAGPGANTPAPISPAPISPVAPAGAAADDFTAGSFTATVSAITNAFGDPTRRSIYLFARDAHSNNALNNDASDGVTVAQVAEHFGVHPNVARHHLDKLAAGGYLGVAVERTEGAGAGRPSKRYRSSAAAPIDVGVRSDDLVLQLLGRALAFVPPAEAEAMAEEVGKDYGRAMARSFTGAITADEDVVVAGQRSLRSAIQAVADALTAHGFAAHAEQRNDQLRIISNHCPFGDVAIEHPVICAVDRGMVKGMLGALYGDMTVSTESSLPRGDRFCTTTV